jgi:hypothetical protein
VHKRRKAEVIKRKFKKEMFRLWNEKYMSGVTKQTMIKALAQAITNYAMSVFQFLVGLCDELTQILWDFWWGDEEEKIKVHWMAWENMTMPNNQGGIGFKEHKMFNKALLAR